MKYIVLICMLYVFANATCNITEFNKCSNMALDCDIDCMNRNVIQCALCYQELYEYCVDCFKKNI